MKVKGEAAWIIVWPVAVGVLFGMLLGGVLYLVSSSPRGTAISVSPPPTPIPMVVHVSGSVNVPGVYELPEGSHVQDAIEAAGGFLEEADQHAINLAAILNDGDYIRVLGVSPTQSSITAVVSAEETVYPQESVNVEEPLDMVNINTASIEELESLPGIGPVTAEKIIIYRQENGLFGSIEEIQDVSGIGPVKFNNIKHLISIDALQ